MGEALRVPNPWVPFESDRDAARGRLFCFPFAGGGASFFRAWRPLVPPGISLCAVQLPGREERMSEAPIARLDDLVGSLADGLVPLLERPFVFFGHSMGAVVAFELTHELRRRGSPLPAHLFVSGAGAPHLGDLRPRIHALPDGDFVEEIRLLGGLPEEVLAAPEVMALLVPRIRADLAMTDLYAWEGTVPLPCPITAFGGQDDPVVVADGLEAWSLHTRGPFRVAMAPGGHFFLNDNAPGMVATMAAALAGR